MCIAFLHEMESRVCIKVENQYQCREFCGVFIFLPIGNSEFLTILVVSPGGDHNSIVVPY